MSLYIFFLAEQRSCPPFSSCVIYSQFHRQHLWLLVTDVPQGAEYPALSRLTEASSFFPQQMTSEQTKQNCMVGNVIRATSRRKIKMLKLQQEKEAAVTANFRLQTAGLRYVITCFTASVMNLRCVNIIVFL